MIYERAIETLLSGNHLEVPAAEAVFRELGTGRAPQEFGKRFLLLMGKKGISADEIFGAVLAFRRLAVDFRRPKFEMEPMDNCGTGGDNRNTFNISTAASFVIAASGIPVAKHGNRGVSSGCGSADLLQALGINIEAPTAQMLYALQRAKIGYFHAPLYHRAMRRVLGLRKELGVKTIFNVIGPLLNPLCVTYQLIGVFDRNLLHPMAETLRRLKTSQAILVHGRDGLDEVSTTAKTDVVMLDGRHIRATVFNPGQLGIKKVTLSALKGGSAADRAADLLSVFSGRGRRALRDAILLNAAFGIWAYDRRTGLRVSYDRARHALNSGAALVTLDTMRELTR